MRRRKQRMRSRVLYLDVMDDSYPLPLQHRDSNRYSDNSAHSDPPEHSWGITQALGVRVPVYEKVQDLIHNSETSERNNTMDETTNANENSN